jgi:hypothetical protein
MAIKGKDSGRSKIGTSATRNSSNTFCLDPAVQLVVLSRLLVASVRCRQRQPMNCIANLDGHLASEPSSM